MRIRNGSTSVARVLAVGLLVVASLGFVGCSSDSDSKSASTASTPSTESSAPSTESTEVAAEALKILVSNDDGYNAPGINALVNALNALPDVEVVVSAPATQQSGKGSNVTEGELTATEEKTLDGYPAFAVQGTPADSVNWALDGGVDMKPDLVITGINAGQNLGKIADEISGTVGAARAATARGIPALATSLGSDSDTDVNEVNDVKAFDTAAGFVVDWVKEHRDGILAGTYSGDEPLLENLNVPMCSEGEPRGVARVELAPTSDHALDPQLCTSTVGQPSDDITAFVNGFVTISTAPLVQVGG